MKSGIGSQKEVLLDAEGKYIILVAEDGRHPPSQNVLRK
jgi:hypothetical protein